MNIKLGPSGGTGGSPFEMVPNPKNGPWTISSIEGRSGTRIDQIELVWRNEQGNTDSSHEDGGSGGSDFNFGIPSGDYLTSIEGSVGHHNSDRIFSLQFHTKNGLKSKTFGTQGTFDFFYQCPEGYQIVGLFGRSGTEVDAIGVYIDLIP